ncbi:hypothetical protein [Phenylobacterium immobile]|uniref:hypothetical protein n=1 Tax=Phenylobacterium immobile TaxID=21 RepID=UPI000A7CE6A9|nr:hypothetical protein [Phenylobacterium immobile]
MTAAHLLIAVDFNATYSCAGFAFVRLAAPPVGSAGGQRRATPWTAAIHALTAALAEPGPATIVTANAKVATLVVALRASAVPDGLTPAEARAWEGLVKAAAGRALGYAPAKADPGTPAAFCAAWAELASERAKSKGDFIAAIPKPNLARLAGV